MANERFSSITMHSLPAEVGRAICDLLDVRAIQNMRLVSKYYKDAATLFLLDDIRLIFKPGSFARLLAIARHPVISKGITTLHYESALLERYKSWEEWEKDIHDRAGCLRSPELGADDEEVELYELALKAWFQRPSHNYTKA
ncbi:MAG: hypothetical protein Q9218_007893 [Villophora microphyllina]